MAILDVVKAKLGEKMLEGIQKEAEKEREERKKRDDELRARASKWGGTLPGLTSSTKTKGATVKRSVRSSEDSSSTAAAIALRLRTHGELAKKELREIMGLTDSQLSSAFKIGRTLGKGQGFETKGHGRSARYYAL
jgi:hypothetical protein